MAPSLSIAELTLGPGGRVAFEDLLGVVRDTREDTIKLDRFPVVGRLSRFLQAWRGITKDGWILEIMLLLQSLDAR